MEIQTTKQKEIDSEKIFDYFVYFRNLIKDFEEKKDKLPLERINGYLKTIEYYKNTLGGIIKVNGIKSLSDERFMNALMNNGYFLDIHPTHTYLSGYLSGSPLVYLGRIIEKRTVIEANNKIHLFLRTRSNELTEEHKEQMIPYPCLLQGPQDQVYTDGNVTWIDHRGFTTDKNIESFFKDSSLEDLESFKHFGFLNYQELNIPFVIKNNHLFDPRKS